jgi:predicted nuclease of restriction endonuclease-like RecB superfamily
LDPDSPRYSRAARDLIAIFGEQIGKTLGELEEAIEKYASSRTDYRILRGPAKVLMSFAEFETRISDSAAIRDAVFERAAGSWPVVRRKCSPLDADRHSILEEVAAGAGFTPAKLEEELYADLPERRRLASFAARRGPEDLIAAPPSLRVSGAASSPALFAARAFPWS